LVLETILDQPRDDLSRTAELRVAESVLEARLGEELSFPVAQALRHRDRAVAVALDDLPDARQEHLLVELDLGEEQDLRCVALLLGGEAAGGCYPPRMAAHHLHDEHARRGLRHRRDVEARLADRGRDVLRHRAESRAVVGDREIVVDRLGDAHAHERIAELLADLRDLPRGVGGVVAAVVEEITYIVGAEYLDQPLVVRAVLLDALELVAARAEGAARGRLQPGDRRRRLLAGVDQVLGESADDAVAPGVDLADAFFVLARGLDNPRGARVDHGGHAARLRIKGVLRFHGLRSTSMRPGPSRRSPRPSPCPVSCGIAARADRPAPPTSNSSRRAAGSASRRHRAAS